MSGRPAALDLRRAGGGREEGSLDETVPLDEATVLRYLQDHCFAPSDSGRLGIELERLCIRLHDPTAPLVFADLTAAVATAEPLPGGSRTTFEPGGQVELSSAVHESVGAACDAVRADAEAIADALAAHGFGLCGEGFDPVRPPRSIHPHPRYAAMASYFGDDEAAGLMMCKTASLQVNVDLGTGEEVERRWRAAHRLGPVLAATFANSPGLGPYADLRSVRALIWDRLDPPRTHAVDQGGDPAGDWATFALDAPVMLVNDTSGDTVGAPAGRMTFRRWLSGEAGLPGPRMADLELHLTTLFPPVRPRGFLELRMLDTLPDPWWQVAVAVTAAAVRDPDVCAAVDDLLVAEPRVSDWAAAAHGLADPVMARAASALLNAAMEAVAEQAPGQLDLTCEYRDRWTRRGRSPADDRIDAWATGAAPLAAQR